MFWLIAFLDLPLFSGIVELLQVSDHVLTLDQLSALDALFFLVLLEPSLRPVDRLSFGSTQGIPQALPHLALAAAKIRLTHGLG